METYLAVGWRFQQAGRYADAARCYHAVLAREPDHADALHLFGVQHHRCGHPARAVELIGRAVALRPAAPAYHAAPSEKSACPQKSSPGAHTATLTSKRPPGSSPRSSDARVVAGGSPSGR